MGNIKNYLFNKLDIRLSSDEYWDFFLASDKDVVMGTGDSCPVVKYDFNEDSIYSGNKENTIYSINTWEGATNIGYSLNSIGLTGIDNGLITFEKDVTDLTNQTLVNTLSGSTLIIPPNENRFVMNRVSGTTGNYVYPIKLIKDNTLLGDHINLCGGFYQGYYKIDGYSYQVLPTRVNQSWAAEFWLKPQDICETTQGTTLNDLYPNNKGMFFYMGTRAENKFWNKWEGSDLGCTKDCSLPEDCDETISEWCTIPKENELSLIGDYGVEIPLSPPQVDIDLVKNGFLIYGRAKDTSPEKLTGDAGSIVANENELTVTNNCNSCEGKHEGLGTKTPCTYDGKGIAVSRTKESLTNTTNPFLIYGRANKNKENCGCNSCCGPQDGYGNETVCSFSGRTSPLDVLDVQADIIDNALGFRIKDDGSIGYRYLKMIETCDDTTNKYFSGVTVEEQYSEPGLIPSDSWSYVVIKFTTDYLSDCELKTRKGRKGRLMIYVNGKLKKVFNDFDELIARRLVEYKDKQIGVPYNISLGGGSQGLLESQTFGGFDVSDRNLPIESNYAGTFIGSISQFTFNTCDLDFTQIQNNYNKDRARYSQ